MTPQIKYVVGDKRRKPVPIVPHIVVGDVEFVCNDIMTMREAQEMCRSLIAGCHTIHEQTTKKYHEEVSLEELKSTVRDYDE